MAELRINVLMILDRQKATNLYLQIYIVSIEDVCEECHQTFFQYIYIYIYIFKQHCMNPNCLLLKFFFHEAAHYNYEPI